jgi:eukaryotic-like serine/threonine-protein kinase
MARPGRYRILRKIADGGMAEIFLASQRGAEGFERPVVLKRILQALVADPQFRNLLIDEAHVAMSLNHSAIAQVLDLGHARGRYFLVLEFVDGWDLNFLIQRMATANFPIPPPLALYISAEVCRALSYAHAKTRDGKALGIVHRDISPHNVLISEQGEVKLTDFGIAKALGRRERTGAGIIKGKLAFMSPEQASGGQLDARSDLFSVGTMLYLMSTGRRPFEAPTDLEAVLRVRQCDFPPPETIKPDIAPQLASVIMRAMRLAPAERYQSAEEMLIAIESVQRTTFQAAGQTELKRWLAALHDKDKVPPIGRAAALPPSDESDVMDLTAGMDLVFDDESENLADQTIASGPPVDFSSVALPPPLPPAALPPRGPTPPPRLVTPTPPTIPSAQALPVAAGSRHRIKALLLLGAASLAGFFYLRAKNKPAEKPPAPPPRPVVRAEKPRPAPEKPKPVPADAQRTIAASPPPDAPPDATTVAAAPTIEPPPQPPPPAVPAIDPGEDEEDLLKHKEPDAEKKVIGAERDPPPPRNPRSGTTWQQEYPSVSVHIVTRPEGAVIKLKDRVFGRAPMNLRFRPGIPIELSFVKSGYQTTTRKFNFGRSKNQTVTVSLSKRQQKKGLFKRLFGG